MKILSMPAGGLGSHYLYKEGEINTALTGGFSITDYTLQPALGVNANGVTFNATSMTVAANNISDNAAIVGTAIKVDLTNYNTITVTYEVNGITSSITYDCSGITGSRYIAIAAYNQTYVSATKTLYVGVSNNKTNSMTEGTNVTGTFTNASALSFNIKEIVLA